MPVLITTLFGVIHQTHRGLALTMGVDYTSEAVTLSTALEFLLSMIYFAGNKKQNMFTLTIRISQPAISTHHFYVLHNFTAFLSFLTLPGGRKGV